MGIKDIGQLFRFQKVGFAFSPSIDSASGILYCWDCAHFSESSRICLPRVVAIKGSWVVGEGPERSYLYLCSEQTF